MPAAGAIRDKNLDRLPDKFRSRITEEIFRLGVDQNDVAGLIDNHHGVRRRLQKLAKPAFRFLAFAELIFQRLVRPLEFAGALANAQVQFAVELHQAAFGLLGALGGTIQKIHRHNERERDSEPCKRPIAGYRNERARRQLVNHPDCDDCRDNGERERQRPDSPILHPASDTDAQDQRSQEQSSSNDHKKHRSLVLGVYFRHHPMIDFRSSTSLPDQRTPDRKSRSHAPGEAYG